MPELLEDCPRCGAQRTTFDVKSLNVRKSDHQSLQPVIETFTVCRACGRSTVFNLQPRTVDATALFVQRPAELANKNVNSLVRVNGYVNIGDVGATPAPAHLPDEVRQSFEEGAKCHALNCPNAAGAMLRLCLDLASKQMLTIVPAAAQQPNAQQRKDLAPRLNWLIDNHYLQETCMTWFTASGTMGTSLRIKGPSRPTSLRR